MQNAKQNESCFKKKNLPLGKFCHHYHFTDEKNADVEVVLENLSFTWWVFICVYSITRNPNYTSEVFNLSIKLNKIKLNILNTC